MDPVSAVLSAIGLGSSAAGSIIGSANYLKGVRETNEANLQIARETNQQNVDLFNQAQSYNTEMFNKTNAYNSPSSQRARLIQAGISPSALADSALASSISSSAPPQMQAAKMEAPNLTPNALQVFGGAAKDFLDTQILSEKLKQEKQASYMRSMDKQFYLTEKMNSIRKEIAEIASKKVQTASDRIRLRYLDDELRDAAVLRDKQIALADANYDNAIATGREIEARTGQIKAMTKADIKHLESADSVAWYEAVTGRKAMENQIPLIREQWQKTRAERYHLRQDLLEKMRTANWRAYAEKWKAKYSYYDMNTRAAEAAIIAAKAVRERLLSKSELRALVNRVFGLDIQDALNSAGNILH